MRGYFGIGVEGLSKPMNAGNLFRSAQAFGASFIFTIAGAYTRAALSDTGHAPERLPLHEFPDVASLTLPAGCQLVGVELLDEATELPSFRHPLRAAYVLGRERGSLSPDLLARCQHVVRIPTRFCINVSVAGAIVMYDRLLNYGRFAERPMTTLAKPEPLAPHVHGQPPRRERPAGASVE